MQSSAKIFSGTGSQYLAERIALKFGIPLGKITISKFSDGEIQPYSRKVSGETWFSWCKALFSGRKYYGAAANDRCRKPCFRL
jgi:hypothetical protein